jgi:hypothetical protein
MTVKILRNAAGRELGRVTRVGTFEVLRDRNGAEIGRYDTVADLTKDASGRIVGRGNLLAYLLDS